MGVGKTTVGERLRAVLECPFIDLDAHIEAQQGARIGDVFARAGEAGFRQLEAAALNEVVARRPFGVIALGGGGALTEAAWRTLRQAGVVVRLEAPVEELARRIHKQDSGATRPLLSGADPQTVLASHLVARERWYARADVCVDTVGKTADIAAGAIVGLLEALKGGTPFGRGGA
ncbi:MAG: shikimate kinase [Myxococcaceae bacterium]